MQKKLMPVDSEHAYDEPHSWKEQLEKLRDARTQDQESLFAKAGNAIVSLFSGLSGVTVGSVGLVRSSFAFAKRRPLPAAAIALAVGYTVGAAYKRQRR